MDQWYTVVSVTWGRGLGAGAGNKSRSRSRSRSRSSAYQRYHVLRDPLPEDDVIHHSVGLHLGFHFYVEDL